MTAESVRAGLERNPRRDILPEGHDPHGEDESRMGRKSVVSAWGWRLPACMTSDDSRLDIMAATLAGEFRRFDFGTCQSREGRSLTAQRRAGASEPGVYAVITDDPGEMRRVLLEDQDSPPGGRGRDAPGGNTPGGELPAGPGG